MELEWGIQSCDFRRSSEGVGEVMVSIWGGINLLRKLSIR